MKKSFVFLLTMSLLFSLCGCSSKENKDDNAIVNDNTAEIKSGNTETTSPDTEQAMAQVEVIESTLSGQYNIEEFLQLIAPAIEAAESAVTYATDEERTEIYQSAYLEAMEAIGFRGGETIIVNGKLQRAVVTTESSVIVLTDKNQSHYLRIFGDMENIAWLVLLNKDTNVKVQFTVSYIEEDGILFMVFSDAEVLSPQKIEYSSNCIVNDGDEDALAEGTIVFIKENEYTKEEIDNLPGANDLGKFWWYNAMRYSTHYIIIQDEEGNQLGAFIDTSNRAEIKLGDKIACKGDVYSTSEEPYLFIYSTLLGDYYVFK